MHLIFDLDGTLYNTERSVMSAVHSLYKELGLQEPDRKSVLPHIGKATPRFLTEILPAAYRTEANTARFQELERAAVAESGQLYPGMDDVLQSLTDEGHRLSVCSNGSEAYIGLVLSATGIGRYFSGIYSSKLSVSKAHKVREILKPGEDTVLIGDAPDDLSAAAENNLPSIAALYGFGRVNPAAATLTAQAPSDIMACVRRLSVFNHIKRYAENHGRRILGISGIDTSGKTEFANAFARYLCSAGRKCLVVHIDDFHNPLALRRQGENEIDAYYNNAFNYRQLIGEILQPLKNTGRIDTDVLCLDLDTDRYGNLRHYEADEDTIVVIEGVLLFRPPVIEYLEGTIFLRIGFEEMLSRARVRDVPIYGEAFLEKYRRKYIPIQRRYLEEYRPDERCDLLIDNSDYNAPVIITR